MKSSFQFIDKNQGSVKDDLLSGITVALALVPEAVAFAFVAGISPIVGLYGAFMMGLITAIFGGRPGMISGATGALAVVMVSLVKEGNAMGDDGAMLGLQYLFATLILTGVLQAAAGFFRMGKFVRMIPHSVMMGFVNGLAIVIFTSQLGMFKSEGNWLVGTPLYTMLGLVGLTMFIMFFLPKLTKKLPAALIAIITVSLLVIFGDIETETVKSFIVAGGGEGIKAGLPSFNIPLIEFIAENNIPSILSTGMSEIEDIDLAYEIFKKNKTDLILLHCVSSYPTPENEMNLNIIETLKKSYNDIHIGYSGHEIGHLPTIAAVCKGARVVERHITLDQKMVGFDHSLSIEPNELSEIIKQIRKIEILMGSFEKRVLESELLKKNQYNVSMISLRNILPNEILTIDDVEFKNPGNGILFKDSEKYIGRKVKHKIKKDEVINPSSFI